jgi:Protein of unknown function (DUF3515)
MGTRVSPPVAIAITLPLLLAVAVAAIAITARVRGIGEPPPPDTGPLPVAPVDAPAASGPECTALLAVLPAELDGPDGPMPPRPVAGAEALPGVRAWAAAPRPVVLRCGLPRPAELTPTSALLEVNGVRWLQLDDGLPQPVQVSYIAVDRPVYLALTTPVDAGSAPLQHLSDLVRETLPATAVAVR